MALPGISRFENRVALVTGGSLGIGEAICKTLVEHGLIVIACARNTDPVQKRIEEYASLGYKGKLHAFKCDVGKDDEVEAMFETLEKTFGGVDVLINNAAINVDEPLLESNASHIRNMLNLNVIGLIMCTKLAIKSMRARGVNDGHVINIGSMLGHELKNVNHPYASTKWAVRALTQGFRKELFDANSQIRITSVCPGMVKTHLHDRVCGGEENAQKMYASLKSILLPEDVANAVLHALSQPQHVQVHDILMDSTGFGISQSVINVFSKTTTN